MTADIVQHSTVRLRGITWDDPRGWGPLDRVGRAFAQTPTGQNVAVVWDIQTLEGFESRSVADLAGEYDLLNLDHPHIGEAVAKRALCAVDPIEDAFVGASLDSYRWDNRVPVDAACQVAACHPVRLTEAPRSFKEILGVAQHHPVAASLAGVHALMALLTLLVQHDAPLSDDPHADWPEPDRFNSAARCLQQLTEHFLPESLDWNPLQLFTAIADGRCDYAPFTFAYVSARNGGVRFAPVPSLSGAPSTGVVLGGTGIAVSAQSTHPDIAIAYAQFAGSDETQRSLWPQNGGQPARRAAWDELAQSDSFYHDLQPAVETVWIRPRYSGWIPRQMQAGQCVNTWLRSPGAAPRLLRAELQQLWRRTA